MDEVERLTRGEASRKGGKKGKARGAGSRAVPHRLTKDEARAFASAKRDGVGTVRASGSRKVWGGRAEGAPLVNALRQLADAQAVACVSIVRDASGTDVVRVDASPLRLLDDAPALDAAVAAAAECGAQPAERTPLPLQLPEYAEGALAMPIWALTERLVEFDVPREGSRELAKALVSALKPHRGAAAK